jgi:DNA-binding NtrC family response regulator
MRCRYGRTSRLVEISCLEPLLSERLIASAERARGGTLLVTDLDRLDEHGQRELRYVLAKCSEWDRPPRLVTTALPELEVLAKKRLFMRSLYDQVAVLRHPIPSLRERFDDLPELCRLLLAEHSLHRGPCGASAIARRTGRAAQLRLAGQRPRAVQHPAASAAVVPRSHRRRGSHGAAVRRHNHPRMIHLPIGTSLAEAEQALILATLHASRGTTNRVRRTDSGSHAEPCTKSSPATRSWDFLRHPDENRLPPAGDRQA